MNSSVISLRIQAFRALASSVSAPPVSQVNGFRVFIILVEFGKDFEISVVQVAE